MRPSWTASCASASPATGPVPTTMFTTPSGIPAARQRATNELALPMHTGGARILHIHHNVPGVLAQVNACLSKAGTNISAQYLGTLQSIGYAVIDLDHSASATALQALSAIPETIRCRALG